MDLSLNSLQRLICHKTQIIKQKSIMSVFLFNGTICCFFLVLVLVIQKFFFLFDYYYNYYYYLLIRIFHIWRLSDSKSPQVSRTLLSILADFNNAVVCMVSTRRPTSKSSRLFNKPLVTVPKAPIKIGIIATFMFHSFFNSLARSRYLSLFSHSFSFFLWTAGTAKSTIF